MVKWKTCIIALKHARNPVGAGLRLWDTCKKKKKTLCLALEYVKNCPLGVSFVTFGSVVQPVRFWLKSLTTHNRQFLQGNL